MTSLDGPGAVAVSDVPDPEPSHFTTPGSGVMIDVRAAGVAFPDVLMTRGGYQDQPDPPFIPGIEVAGTVAAASADCDLSPGDRVAAYSLIGGLAEQSVAPVHATFPLPGELDFSEGAGLVVNYHTACFALDHRATLRTGETVLVHGAAGGLGSAAVQVARGLGAAVIAVVSSAEKEGLARAAGATEAIRVDAPWPEAARELLGTGGVDIVFDPVGGDRALDSLRLLRPDGRYVVAGFTSGKIPEVKANRLLMGNMSVVGAGWGAYIGALPQAAGPIGEKVNRLVAEGHIRPAVGARFALEDAGEALRLIESRRALGKVVVEIGRRAA